MARRARRRRDPDLQTLVRTYWATAQKGRALADRWVSLVTHRQRLIEHRDDVLRELSATLRRSERYVPPDADFYC